MNHPWECKTCGWTLGQVGNESLQIFAQAIHGCGVGATPEVRAVVPAWARSPVRCSHCGTVRIWSNCPFWLRKLMEDILGRELTTAEANLLIQNGG